MKMIRSCEATVRLELGWNAVVLITWSLATASLWQVEFVEMENIQGNNSINIYLILKHTQIFLYCHVNLIISPYFRNENCSWKFQVSDECLPKVDCQYLDVIGNWRRGQENYQSNSCLSILSYYLPDVLETDSQQKLRMKDHSYVAVMAETKSFRHPGPHFFLI